MSEQLGILPIVKKFLQPNYLFALQVREGFYFGRVIRRRICQYAPFEVVDSDGNDVDIPASTHQGEIRFRDPRNVAKSVLHLDAETNSGLPWFYHGAIGVAPDPIRLYLRYPEGDIIPGKFPNLDPVRPAQGDNFSFINGFKSPYDCPTDYLEMVIPPKVELGAEYYNNDPDRAHQPKLNLFFALYWCEIFTPVRDGDLVASIASRTVPASYLTMGFGDDAYDFNPEDWKVGGQKVNAITLDEARRLGRTAPPRSTTTPAGGFTPGARARELTRRVIV